MLASIGPCMPGGSASQAPTAPNAILVRTNLRIQDALVESALRAAAPRGVLSLISRPCLGKPAHYGPGLNVVGPGGALPSAAWCVLKAGPGLQVRVLSG